MTFADLGIPFPLFEGRVEDCADYVGRGQCSFCSEIGHCFSLGVGAEVIQRCSNCGEETAVNAHRGRSPCIYCGRENSLQASAERLSCYGCLRAGRVALTKDTEHGIVRWEDAVRGRAHGLPRGSYDLPDALREEHPGYDEICGVELKHIVPISSAATLELVRTPTYISWQGEQWPFHYDWPMVFLGTWGKAEFERASRGRDGKQLFLEAVRGSSGGTREDEMIWNALGPNAEEAGSLGVYVFRPFGSEGPFRAHYDFD